MRRGSLLAWVADLVAGLSVACLDGINIFMNREIMERFNSCKGMIEDL